MKQITFRMKPGTGYAANRELVEEVLREQFSYEPGSVVIEDVPDPTPVPEPEIVQLFEIRRKAHLGPLSAEDVTHALSAVGRDASVEVLA